MQRDAVPAAAIRRMIAIRFAWEAPCPMMREIESPEAFLAWEGAQGTRHEFIGGRVHPIACDTVAQNTIKGNVFAALKVGCRQKNCRVFVSSMRVITPTEDVLYPDIVIGADNLPGDATFLASPFAVVDVRSSEMPPDQLQLRYAVYQRIPSLRRHVLIPPDRRSVDMRVRQDQQWTCDSIEGSHAIVAFGSLGVTISIAEIYAGLDG